jgi:hypothetical protein
VALALTQVYLEPLQKQALSHRARSLKRKPSEAIREAIDAYVAGVSLDDLKLLQIATAKAEEDLTAMVEVLDAAQTRADAFFAAIEKAKVVPKKVKLEAYS